MVEQAAQLVADNSQFSVTPEDIDVSDPNLFFRRFGEGVHTGVAARIVVLYAKEQGHWGPYIDNPYYESIRATKLRNELGYARLVELGYLVRRTDGYHLSIPFIERALATSPEPSTSGTSTV